MHEKIPKENNKNQFIKQANRSKLCFARGDGEIQSGWRHGSEKKNRTIKENEREKMKQFKCTKRLCFCREYCEL